MATIKDVAQAAQVSAAAVSRVLNKDENISVSPEVRVRIFRLRTRWAISLRGSARQLSIRRTLLLVWPTGVSCDRTGRMSGFRLCHAWCR